MGEELVRGEGVGPTHHSPQATIPSLEGGVPVAPGANPGMQAFGLTVPLLIRRIGPIRPIHSALGFAPD